MSKFIETMMKPRKWFNVAKKDDEAEIFIYDVIGADFWGDGLTAKSFVKEFSELEKSFDTINIRINSPGGYISDGLTIYNRITQSEKKINAYIDGMAASAASFLAMAADEIYMPPTAEMLIHNPWGFAMGDSAEMKKIAAQLDTDKKLIVSIYSKKTGMKEEDISLMMDDETWMDGDRAFELGFATQLLEDHKAAACAFDLDLFPGLPDGFIKYQNALKKREKEHSLRDAGLSKNKAVIALSRSDSDNIIKKQAQETFNKEFQKWANNLPL